MKYGTTIELRQEIEQLVEELRYDREMRALTETQIIELYRVSPAPAMALLILKKRGAEFVMNEMKAENWSLVNQMQERKIRSLVANSQSSFNNLLERIESLRIQRLTEGKKLVDENKKSLDENKQHLEESKQLLRENKQHLEENKKLSKSLDKSLTLHESYMAQMWELMTPEARQQFIDLNQPQST